MREGTGFLCVGILMSILLTVSVKGRAADHMYCRKKVAHALDMSRKLSATDILHEMKSLSGDCGDDPAYLPGLATAYLDASRYEQAESVARTSLDKDGVDRPFAYSIIFRSLLLRRHLSEAHGVALHVIKTFPKSYRGYLLLGKYFTIKNEFADAVVALNKSVAIEGSSEAFQYLTVNYYNLNKFRHSVSSFMSSARINNVIYYDRLAVLTAAASAYELGKYNEASRMLDMHLKYVPSDRSDKQLVKLKSLLVNKVGKGSGGR